MKNNPHAERFTDLVILLKNEWIFTTNQYTESRFDGRLTGPQRPPRTTFFSFTLSNRSVISDQSKKCYGKGINFMSCLMWKMKHI